MDTIYIEELYHQGAKGQNFGDRTYQDEDSALAEKGSAFLSSLGLQTH